MAKFKVGDRVTSVLHGAMVVGTCTKYVPEDPSGFIYHFEFNDGTKICMTRDRVNREVIPYSMELPEHLEAMIKKKDD